MSKQQSHGKARLIISAYAKPGWCTDTRGMSFDRLLVRLREDRGLYAVDLGKMANLSTSSISRYENGHELPRRNTAIKIFNALDGHRPFTQVELEAWNECFGAPTSRQAAPTRAPTPIDQPAPQSQPHALLHRWADVLAAEVGVDKVLLAMLNAAELLDVPLAPSMPLPKQPAQPEQRYVAVWMPPERFHTGWQERSHHYEVDPKDPTKTLDRSSRPGTTDAGSERPSQGRSTA